MCSVQEQKEDNDVAPIEQVEFSFRESERNKENSQISSRTRELEDIGTRNKNGMSTNPYQ
jgi:hypothetical protein